MKVEKVKIANFRSIENANFHIEDIVAIVGQNNSGKSALMRALNSFFNRDKELDCYIDGANLYTTKRAIPRITIEFIDVPDKEIYNKYIREGKMTLQQEYSKKKQQLEYYVLFDNLKERLPEVFVSEFLSEIRYILIPTERAIKYQGLEETPVLQQILDSIFSSRTAKRDTLSPKVQNAFDFLKKNALDKISKEIGRKYLISRGLSVEIDSNVPLDYNIFIKDIVIRIIENNKNFKLEECGSGVQSLVAISIYRYLAEINNINYIIGIEEPEINLHPHAQKELIFDLVEEISNSSNNLQLIFTTHSPSLIDELDHTDIILVRKTVDSKRGFKTVISQLEKDFWDKYNLDEIKYRKFHRFHNSDFFFAKHVLITEGNVDAEVFRQLFRKNDLIIERHGISILELDGIKSLAYAFYLLKGLNIPKTMVVDKDFFFAYKNVKKDESRNSRGFFTYSKMLNRENKSIIEDIIDEHNVLSNIVELHRENGGNHRKMLDFMIDYDVILMNYNLEMDLFTSRTTVDLICDKLGISSNDRKIYKVLVDKKKVIKRPDFLLDVIEDLSRKNLPLSYKKIIIRMKDVVKH